jgi:hypothetical protein
MDIRDLIQKLDAIASEAKDKDPVRLTIQDVMPQVEKIIFSPPSSTMIKYSSANNPAFADKDINDPKIKAELFNAEIKQSPGRLMGDIAARIKPTDDVQIEISNLMNNISDKIAEKKPISKDESAFVMAVMKKALKDMPLEKDPDKSKYDDNEGEDEFEDVQTEAGKLKSGKKDPCWSGYEMVGMKKKGGKEVPNCVPKEDSVNDDEQLDEIPIGAVASGIGRGVAAGARGVAAGAKAVGGAAVKGAQAVGKGAVAGAKAVGKMTSKGIQGLRRVAGQMKMGNQTSKMITGLNALMTKGTAQGMGAQGLQTILGPIQQILNDPQLSTEFIRLMKKAEAKAKQMQTNDIHNESVQFDEVVDYDLIENIFKEYYAVDEADGGKKEQLKAWYNKYSKYKSNNYSNLVWGMIKAWTDTGILSDAYEENEWAAVVDKFGEDKADEMEPDQVLKYMPITKAAHDEIEEIFGKGGEDTLETVHQMLTSMGVDFSGKKIEGMNTEEADENWFQGQHDVILNGDEFYETFGWVGYDDESIEEAEYQGRSVKLNKPMRGDVKKFKVYVKNPKGNVVKVNFGDPDMKIKRSIPARRKSFRARHNCDSPGPKTKARYWSCKKW